MIKLLLSLLFISSSQAQQKDDQLAIAEVIREAYIDGVFNEGNTRNVELGFSEHFQMLGFGEDGMPKAYDLNYFLNRIERKQAAGAYPPPDSLMVRYKILRTDIEGQSASVKMNFYIGKDLRYVDFLHLLKTQRGWLISHKVFKTIAPSK